jgi:hypothetical protein
VAARQRGCRAEDSRVLRIAGVILDRLVTAATPGQGLEDQPQTGVEQVGFRDDGRAYALASTRGASSAYTTGVTSRASTVELTNPPMITHAIGA